MKKTEITSFLQGYAKAGDTSEYAVKTPVFRGICTDKVIIDIVDDNVQFALVGYSDPTPKNLVFELKWYTENQKTFNLSSYSKGVYWVVVLTNKNGSQISPADVSSVTITIENLWYIDTNSDLRFSGMPYAPEKIMSKPYPASLWRIDQKISDIPCHKLMPLEIQAGAFMGAKNLEYARIPETVRKICRYAFANTALQKVKISPECEYHETSFLEDCVIEFYGNNFNKHSGQLYDSKNNILIDIDGARIYVKE